MIVTRRSSSSEVSSPARLFRSTSAFLHTRLAVNLVSHVFPRMCNFGGASGRLQVVAAQSKRDTYSNDDQHP